MLDYKQIRGMRKYVKVEDHAIEKYRERFSPDSTDSQAVNRLKGAYLRGDKLQLHGAKRRMGQFFKYQENASYYKYGNIVVVVREVGDRYDTGDKIVLTCYPYKSSKFDPDVLD